MCLMRMLMSTSALATKNTTFLIKDNLWFGNSTSHCFSRKCSLLQRSKSTWRTSVSLTGAVLVPPGCAATSSLLGRGKSRSCCLPSLESYLIQLFSKWTTESQPITTSLHSPCCSWRWSIFPLFLVGKLRFQLWCSAPLGICSMSLGGKRGRKPSASHELRRCLAFPATAQVKWSLWHNK